MKCPNCNSTLSLKSNRCDRCGEDIRIYKRVVKASNAFYNQGLMKAKVRDLSGAVIALKKSLELDKTNTNARNLLGLVYFEMGETVSALSEWVISKHFQSEDNDADEYMAAVQKNPTRLENINQAIKKYNSALMSAKQGSPDLAIIQLKKVINLNSNFIRAYQLLALLYIHAGEKEKAEKQLKKALQIDVNNIVTLKYLQQLGIQSTKVMMSPVKEEKLEAPKKEFTSYIPVGKYKEEKHNVWTYINLVLGVIIGIAVCYLLLFPTIMNSQNGELQRQLKEKDTKISSLESDKTAVTNENVNLQKQVEALSKELEGIKTEVSGDSTEGDVTIYDLLFQSATLMLQNQNKEAALLIVSLEEEKITDEHAKALYTTIKNDTFKNASKEIYAEGYKLYEQKKYEEALEKLMKAEQLDVENADAVYFVARCYDRLEDKENAKAQYQKVIDQFDGTKRATQAKERIQNL